MKILLGRSPVHLDTKGIRNYLDGKTILITGCGGSIGSELCRQVMKYQPRKLILLDSSESNLFNIQMEMQNENYGHHCEAVLGRVQDEDLMNHVFEKYKPEVVFHAAAYKHVPMLEKNPWQAVFNNIIGSRVVMEMAIKYHVERFVVVSTDKAVRPTNVMGASKRVTELIMQCQQGNGTKFMAVRFGNVVGSSGSVIPFFRRQIEQGRAGDGHASGGKPLLYDHTRGVADDSAGRHDGGGRRNLYFEDGNACKNFRHGARLDPSFGERAGCGHQNCFYRFTGR